MIFQFLYISCLCSFSPTSLISFPLSVSTYFIHLLFFFLSSFLDYFLLLLPLHNIFSPALWGFLHYNSIYHCFCFCLKLFPLFIGGWGKGAFVPINSLYSLCNPFSLLFITTPLQLSRKFLFSCAYEVTQKWYNTWGRIVPRSRDTLLPPCR